MKKVRKNIIKKAAKIYAANLICNSMGTGADTVLFNEGERSYFCEELYAIAKRLNKDITAPTLDDAMSAAIEGK